MDSFNWLVGGFFVFILIAVSSLFILGCAWRSPVMVNGVGSAAAGILTSRFRATLRLPVPDEQDEDYLESRSYA